MQQRVVTLRKQRWTELAQVSFETWSHVEADIEPLSADQQAV